MKSRKSIQSIKSKVYTVAVSFLVVISLFYFTLYASPFTLHVNAQSPKNAIMQVSPVILNISLSPGKTYHYIITIKNLLATPLPLRANFENLGPTNDEEGTPSTFSELLTWSSVDQSNMIIPARETKALNLTVRLPHTIPVGGYYGTLFLEPILPIKDASESSVQTKVGVIMLANIGVPDPQAKKGEITRYLLNKWFYDKGLIATNFRVKNVSLYHFSAKPFVKIKPLFGQEETHEIEEKIILPGKSRAWEKEIQLNSNNPGFYRATLAVSVGNGQQITQTRFFAIIPMYVTVTFIMLLFLAIIIPRRKSLRKAGLILVGKSK